MAEAAASEVLVAMIRIFIGDAMPSASFWLTTDDCKRLDGVRRQRRPANRLGFTGDSISGDDEVMNKTTRYSPDFRERAVRMVFEHQAEYASQWPAMGSIAAKVGCTAETLQKWVRQAGRATLNGVALVSFAGVPPMAVSYHRGFCCFSAFCCDHYRLC